MKKFYLTLALVFSILIFSVSGVSAEEEGLKRIPCAYEIVRFPAYGETRGPNQRVWWFVLDCNDNVLIKAPTLDAAAIAAAVLEEDCND